MRKVVNNHSSGVCSKVYGEFDPPTEIGIFFDIVSQWQ